MLKEDKILKARKNVSDRNKLIKEYSNYILSCASKAAGRYVDTSDDLYSEAMIAFNEAIMHYSAEKGSFEAFAAKVIHNRIIDWLRIENRHNKAIPLSALSTQNERGDDVDFEIEDKNAAVSETAIEIEALKKDLSVFEISFFDIPSASPKSRKTILACISAAEYIVSDKELLRTVYEKKTLPVKKLIENLGVGKKIPERYRKYIIMAVLILDGDYEILKDHLKNGKKVRG